MPEVHQKKPQIVQHIDRRKIGAVLQTIERNRLAVDHSDVGEVQIAMPVTDARHSPPHFPQRRKTTAQSAMPRDNMENVGEVATVAECQQALDFSLANTPTEA